MNLNIAVRSIPGILSRFGALEGWKEAISYRKLPGTIPSIMAVKSALNETIENPDITQSIRHRGPNGAEFNESRQIDYVPIEFDICWRTV